jgi:hypothetical protein
MKTIYFCVLVHCLTPAFAQQSLVGRWQFNLSAALESDVVTRAQFDSLPQLSKSRISNSFESRTFTFKNDGIVEISWLQNGAQRNVEGTFDFNSSTMEVVIALPGGEHKFKILVVTDSVLLLRDQNTKGLFRQFHFTKT